MQTWDERAWVCVSGVSIVLGDNQYLTFRIRLALELLEFRLALGQSSPRLIDVKFAPGIGFGLNFSVVYFL